MEEGGSQDCHQMTHGGGKEKESSKVSRDTFWIFFNENLTQWSKKIMKNVTSHRGRVRENIPKCHMGKGGGLKSAKKVSRIIWMAPKNAESDWLSFRLQCFTCIRIIVFKNRQKKNKKISGFEKVYNLSFSLGKRKFLKISVVDAKVLKCKEDHNFLANCKI